MALSQYTAPPAYKFTVTQLQCTGCGAETHAACSCGKPYVPAAQRVAEYDKANPGQSARRVAAETRADRETVTRVRARGGMPPPKTVTGRDGKEYPAATAPDYHTANRVWNVLEYLNSEFDPLDLSRALSSCTNSKEIDRINRALDLASKHLDDVRAAMARRATAA
jgi:hypothetical protein